MRYGLESHRGPVRLAEARAKIERRRMELNEAMARIFDRRRRRLRHHRVATPTWRSPPTAPCPRSSAGSRPAPGNNGRLTFPANLHGNPAISIPAGTLDGLPIGLQVVGRHFTEPLLLDLALTVERTRPWPLVAPGSPL